MTHGFLYRTGKPHTHPSHPDYVPSVFPKVYGAKSGDYRVSDRFKRFQKRRTASTKTLSPSPTPSSGDIVRNNLAKVRQDAERHEAATSLIELANSNIQKDQETQTDATTTCETSNGTTRNVGIQVSNDDSELLPKHKVGVSIIQGSDKLTQTFTGLPSWAMFMHLFLYLSPFMHNPVSMLSTDDELFLILLRLRLNLIYEDLAQRFAISTSTVQRILERGVDVMYYRLKFLIKWPSREVVRNNLPPAFRELYPKCVCIIDCSEVFIDIPHSLGARSATYSNYKKT